MSIGEHDMSLRLKRTLWGLLTILDNFFLAFVTDRPRRVRFVNSVIAFTQREKLKDRFPTVAMPTQVAASHAAEIVLDPANSRPGSVAFSELCVLCALVRAKNARTVFEFGTFEGNTSYHFALNMPVDGRVYTVNLPPGAVPRLKSDDGDDLFHPAGGSRHRWEGTMVGAKVELLQSDSASLDVSAFTESMDLVFIDGGHSREYLENDTSLAFRMVRPGGLIVWHDYMVWNDVTTFLNAFSRGHHLEHIAGTSLVIYAHGDSHG
jgi:predicted O-methyltransferase YrrM